MRWSCGGTYTGGVGRGPTVNAAARVAYLLCFNAATAARDIGPRRRASCAHAASAASASCAATRALLRRVCGAPLAAADCLPSCPTSRPLRPAGPAPSSCRRLVFWGWGWAHWAAGPVRGRVCVCGQTARLAGGACDECCSDALGPPCPGTDSRGTGASGQQRDRGLDGGAQERGRGSGGGDCSKRGAGLDF